ncbi:IS1595 family transposase [Phocaeicola sp.]
MIAYRLYFTIFVSEDITDQNLQIMPKKKENPERFDLERFERLYPTEDACVKALEKHLWNGILRSPVDGNTNVIRIKGKPGYYRDLDNRRTFTIKQGTVFDGSKLKLKVWFRAIYEFCVSANGISSYELARCCGVTQKTAWFMKQRMALNVKQCEEMLMDGEVEADECYVGGTDYYRKNDAKWHSTQGNRDDKATVFGLLCRDGLLYAEVVKDCRAETLFDIIKNRMAEGCRFYTDEAPQYVHVSDHFIHKTVNHSGKVWKAGAACTNGIENFWKHLQSTIQGTYMSVSYFHLQKYVDEKAWRFNTRRMGCYSRFSFFLSLLASGNSTTYSATIKPGRVRYAAGKWKGERMRGRMKDLLYAE